MPYRVPLAAVLAAALLPAEARIRFADAYPKLEFAKPVYFGAFPGRARTNVVLEQHRGNALLVYRKGEGWAKDTLFRRAVHTANEMGLLGIAFHPAFNANRKYYVSYDPPGELFNIVEERLADATGMKDSGKPGRVLLKIADRYENHNGGTLAFGPKDGFLYFGTGDGGSRNDPLNSGQDLNSLLGKMLRIDVDRKDPGSEYGIPADNPFRNGGGRAEIFAYGLRNPWKFAFDPLNGDLWVGDVGQNAWEEVDIVTLGGNYGWKPMEGPAGPNPGDKYRMPVFWYDRDKGVSVTGGVVYRGSAESEWYGAYFLADYGSRAFWALRKSGTGAVATELGEAPAAISSFGTDAEGRVYACGHDDGKIYRLDAPGLVPDSSAAPKGSLLGKYRRIWTAAPGERLPGRAFARAPLLEIRAMGGALLGAVRAVDPALPMDMGPGTYLLKPIAGDGAPDLLRVR